MYIMLTHQYTTYDLYILLKCNLYGSIYPLSINYSINFSSPHLSTYCLSLEGESIKGERSVQYLRFHSSSLAMRGLLLLLSIAAGVGYLSRLHTFSVRSDSTPQMSTPRIESYFLWYLLPLKFPITVISKCCMCEILKFIHYWLQNPIQGCQSLSVYSGSGYIDSKCYDEKQVDLAIKSNCYYSYSLKQQAIVHLFEWHWDWIADECEKVTKSLSWNLIIFFKIEGWGIFQSIELPSQCARFLDQRDSVEYRCLPQQSMFRWILRFNFCTFFLFAPLLPPLNQLSSMFEQGGQWWTRYQPVSYKLESRFQIWRRKSLQNNRKKA